MDGFIKNPWARIVSSHVCVTTFVDEILFRNQMHESFSVVFQPSLACRSKMTFRSVGRSRRKTGLFRRQTFRESVGEFDWSKMKQLAPIFENIQIWKYQPLAMMALSKQRIMVMVSMALLSVLAVFSGSMTKSILRVRRDQENSSLLNSPGFSNSGASLGFNFSGLTSGSGNGSSSGMNFFGMLGLSGIPSSRPTFFASTFNTQGFLSFSRPTPSPPKPPTPTSSPVKSPTKAPSRIPTKQPSRSPTKKPSSSPTKAPIPSVFYGRDFNPLLVESYPSTESDAARARFLKLFNFAISSPEQNFDSLMYDPNADTRQYTLEFATIGQVVLSSLNVGISSGLNPKFNTRLFVATNTTLPLRIQFQVPVVAVGFYIMDLEEIDTFIIKASRNGAIATTFVITQANPPNGNDDETLAYIGLVHLAGFDYLEMPPVNDNVFIDFFSVFKSSELL
jgi:hypothetical protein